MAENRFEDVQLTDPQTMRALAHPVRLAILEELQRNGPSTATALAPLVGATPSVTSWHLRHLASFGLVRDAAPSADRRVRRWEAVARGFSFETPEDPADVQGRAAARQLSEQLFRRSAELPLRWVEQVEPELEPRWRRLAGLGNTRVMVSAAELEHLEDAIDAVLAPYVTRAPQDRPESARGVRFLRYVLPEPPAQP